MMEIPKVFDTEYVYLDKKTEKWKIKDDAPAWAKKEYEEFQKKVNPVPDSNGLVTNY